MSLRCVITVSLAALAMSGSAKAERSPAPSAAIAIAQTAAATHDIAQLASVAIVVPAIADPVVPAEIAMPIPAALANEPAVAAAPGRRKHAKDKLADAKNRRDKAAAPEAICVQAIGKAETGTAAWYGGRYVGRRTSSGSRLDSTHPTAAHRTLPLNSLARVTNLDNGRSVVVRVTDRGPLSHSLLIDMSPRAAEELHMKHAGLVPVTVEQVVEVPADSK